MGPVIGALFFVALSVWLVQAEVHHDDGRHRTLYGAFAISVPSKPCYLFEGCDRVLRLTGSEFQDPDGI